MRGPIDRYNIVGHRKKDAIRESRAKARTQNQACPLYEADYRCAPSLFACVLPQNMCCTDPTPNAHVPVIQLMLNHLCPGPNQKIVES